MRCKLLVAMLMGAVVSAPSVVRAEQSASITLRGFVPEVSSLRLVDINPIVSHDLRSDVVGALVARIMERSNARNGYSIRVISESAQTKSSAGLVNRRNGILVPYFLSYGGQRLQFRNGEAEIKRPLRPKGERELHSDLRMSTDGAAAIPSGEYSDTITLVISSK